MLRISKKYLARLIKEEFSQVILEKDPTISKSQPAGDSKLQKMVTAGVASWLQGNAGSLAAAAEAAQAYEPGREDPTTYGDSLRSRRAGPEDSKKKSQATGKNSGLWLSKWMKNWRPAPVRTPFGLISVKNKDISAIIDTSLEGDAIAAPLYGFNIDASLELLVKSPSGQTKVPINIKNVTIELGFDRENLPKISGRFSKTKNFEEKSVTHDVGLNFELKNLNFGGGVTTTKGENQPNKKTRYANIGSKIGKNDITLTASGNSLKDWSTSISIGNPDSSISFTGAVNPGEVSSQANADLPDALRGAPRKRKFNNLSLGAQYTRRFE
tara:strand:- start:6987 stop:7964 length:978 start_codon:yes stop_codon:yes gene_type:complete